MFNVSIITAVLIFALFSATESLTFFRLETATIPCGAYSQTNSTTVRWEGPAGSGLNVSSTNTSVLVNTRWSLLLAEDFSLQIESLVLEDAGTYRCIVSRLSDATVDLNATFDIATPTPNTIAIPTAIPTAATGFQIEEVSSNVQLVVKDPEPPGKPYGEDVGPKQITLVWENSDGPVKSYLVEYSSQDSTKPNNDSVTTNGSSITIQNLQPFTFYVFQVFATFKQNYTKQSLQSIIQTGSGTPLSPPINVSAFVEGSQQINLTWEAPPPDSLQGIFVTYVVRFQEKSVMTMEKFRSTVKPNFMLTDLKPYTTYQLSVAVQNNATKDISLGPFSEVLEAVTEEDIPSAPLRLKMFAFLDTQFVILWELPRPTNGEITGYHVYIREEGIDDWTKRESTQPVYAFLNRKPYTRYEVKVSALTRIGEGPNSTAIIVMTDVASPSAPRNVSVGSITNVSALITWVEPEVFYNSIDAYIIKYWERQSNNMTKETVQIGKSKVLTNLTPGRSYFVTVSASTLNIQKDPLPVVGEESDRVSFRVQENGNGMTGRGGTMSQSSQGRGWKILLILFLIGITVGLLVFLYFGFVARKRQQMNFKQNGSRVMFAFSKPEELEEPPIPVDRFEEHVIANHADSDGGFATEYEDIQAVGNNFAALAGQEEGNKLKNRYTNIVAYDHTRVSLQTLPGHLDSHYINANYVDSYNQQGAYIATQGPLQNTIEDFWRMIWEQKCRVIVMITKLEERGRRKCERYWPSKGMAERFRDIEVSMDGKEKFCTYVLRTFNLRYKPRRHGKAQEMIVKHYHYIDWPDHGVPSHTLPVLDFVLRSSEANPEGAGPMIVHCSAGVGRTGTYIVIDSMLKQIKDCGKVNVFGFLKRIRTQRNYLVQTEEQYVFIHDVLLEWVMAGDTRIQAFNLKDYTEKMDLPDENGLIPLDVQHDQIMTQRIHAYQFMRARNPMNKPKNRNSQVLPVERGRVTITGRPGVENSDYINASFLPGYWYRDAFIVTQYPLESTVAEFWKMLWENNCTIIVMLTGKEEVGKEKPEEESIYWPSKKDEPVTFEALKVTLLEEEMSNMEFVTRDFLIESLQDEDPLQIRQYSCSYWPESCSPIHTTFDLINAVQKHCKQSSENSKYMNGPIVVHDRCGGRQAGTFCALSTLLDEMKEEKCVNIYKTVKIYSATRVGMFKNKEDYQFLYRTLSSAYTIEKQLQSIERQKVNRSRSRKIHRDWSFMVRQPVTSMDFRASHSPRRNSLDGDEFRGRSQTLGSTGRVARPTKFWHRRARSEKRKPIFLNGDAAIMTENLPCENGEAGGEVYDLESLQSYETDKMVDGDYPIEGDLGDRTPDKGKTSPDSSRTPTVTITTAPNLPNDQRRERRLSSCSTDKLVQYNQAEDKVQFKNKETIETAKDEVQMETKVNGLETNLNGVGDANELGEEECIV